MADGALKGYSQLQARLKAVQGVSAGSQIMKTIGQSVVGRLKANVVHKTSNTSRSIHLASVTNTSARIEGSAVALYIDTGTGLYGPKKQKITPKAAKVLRFHSQQKGTAAGASYRLTGTMRKASQRKLGQNADLVFVRSVKGMKPRPYIHKSIGEAAGKLGLEIAGDIVKAWDSAR